MCNPMMWGLIKAQTACILGAAADLQIMLLCFCCCSAAPAPEPASNGSSASDLTAAGAAGGLKPAAAVSRPGNSSALHQDCSIAAVDSSRMCVLT